MDIVELIDKFGIATAMCAGMGVFVKYMFDKFMLQGDSERQAHKEEIEHMTEVVNNNTIALNRIIDQIKEDV